MKYISLSNNAQAVASALGIQSYKIKDTILDVFKTMEIKYPNFDDWFGKIFVEVLMEDVRRDIILAMDGNKIAGILILKDMDGEKKVCNIVVLPEYRKQGVATELFELAFEYLGTRKPMISMSQDLVPSFAALIRKYKFKLTNIDYTYNKNKIEFYYN
jgi:ribosomal protein S18 acetylase RimI-like enzyme